MPDMPKQLPGTTLVERTVPLERREHLLACLKAQGHGFGPEDFKSIERGICPVCRKPV
jgi:hypothetical protein